MWLIKKGSIPVEATSYVNYWEETSLKPLSNTKLVKASSFEDSIRSHVGNKLIIFSRFSPRIFDLKLESDFENLTTKGQNP